MPILMNADFGVAKCAAVYDQHIMMMAQGSEENNKTDTLDGLVNRGGGEPF